MKFHLNAGTGNVFTGYGEDYVRLADEVLGRLGMTAARKELGAQFNGAGA